jgi:MFS family permease
MHVTHGQASTPPKQLWFIFALICVPIIIGSIDLTAIVVILPQATLELLGTRGLTRTDLALWVVTAYLLAYTISLALVGRLSDALPRKMVFIACCLIFIFGALWSAFATELPLRLVSALTIWPDRELLPLITLIIGRVIQAIGAGASVSVGMALVGDLFPPERRAEPISLIGALDSLGWVIGNLYAGLLLQILPSWKTLFLINAVVALVALPFTIWVLHRAPTTKSTGLRRFDFLGAILLAATILLLTIGVEETGKGLNGGPLIALSLATFVIFVFLESRLPNPLINMRFVRLPAVRPALLLNLLIGFALILVVAGVPVAINLRVVFLRGEGLLSGALQAGLMLCALTLPLLAAVLVGEVRYRKGGAALPVSFGLALAAVGFLLSTAWAYTSPAYVVALPLALIGVGLGLTIGPLSLVVIDVAEDSQRGLASSLVLMMRLLGMTIGTPLAASFTLTLANQWAGQQTDQLNPFFHNIARPMLVPPMAVTALTHIFVAGAVICALGAALFYGRAALRNLRAMPLRQNLAGLPLLAVVIIGTGLGALLMETLLPTVANNPIARSLPANVEVYVGVNVQRLFLANAARPLDAVVVITERAIEALTASQSVTANSNVLTSRVQSGPAPISPGDTPTDQIVKVLFQPRQWKAENYVPFCNIEVPLSDVQWCFNGALLGWIGPQAAFAVFPKVDGRYEYLFAFQATNRNNAIKFATDMAISLGEAPPKELRPNVLTASFNADLPFARTMAVTEAYVYIGTPGAVAQALAQTGGALTANPDFIRTAGRANPENFANVYIRANDLTTDIGPLLTVLLPPGQGENSLRLAAQALQATFPRVLEAPPLLSLGLRVTQTALLADFTSQLPYNLARLGVSRFNALPRVPVGVPLWGAFSLDIAGLARSVDVSRLLAALAKDNDALGNQLDNPAVNSLLSGILQTFQRLLLHAAGEIAFFADSNGGGLAIILPLANVEATPPEDTLAEVQNLLTLGGLFGVVIETETIDGLTIRHVHGPVLSTTLPSGIYYTLDAQKQLILSNSRGVLLAALKPTNQPPELPEKNIYSFYLFALPPAENTSVLATGQIEEQTFSIQIKLLTNGQ